MAALAVASGIGALNGWTLVTTEVARAAADDGLFPRAFGWTDRKDTAWFGVVMAALLPSLLMLWSLHHQDRADVGMASGPPRWRSSCWPARCSGPPGEPGHRRRAARLAGHDAPGHGHDMIDRDTFVQYPYLERQPRSWTLTSNGTTAPSRYRNRDLWDTVAEVLGWTRSRC